jgi:hypothetical protein
MIISLPSTPWFYRTLNAILIALVAWLAAGFVWLLLAPASTPPVAAPAKGGGQGPRIDLTPIAQLFGEPQSTEGEAASTLTVKLRGVVAAHEKLPAVAIFEGGDPNSSAVALGGELQSGVRLVEIAADHIVVDNHGRRERLDLDTKPAAVIDTNVQRAPVQASPLINPVPPEAHPAGPPPAGPMQHGNPQEHGASLQRRDTAVAQNHATLNDFPSRLTEILALAGNQSVANANLHWPLPNSCATAHS